MIELVIRNNDNSITKTIVNVKFVRWLDFLSNRELLIWIVGNKYPLIFTNEILVENTIEDVYKHIRMLLRK